MLTKIAKIIQESETIRSFILKDFFEFAAGQWMYVRLNPELKHIFTISSSPSDHYLQFTTKFRSESEYKNYLWKLKEGSDIEVIGPFGNFVVQNSQPKLFIAGGMGITPFNSILKTTKAELIYVAKNSHQAAFSNKYTVFVTETEGHLNLKKIQSLVPDYHTREWYVCGPSNFVDEIKKIAESEKIICYAEDMPGYLTIS